jgi:TP901 family phage tail tape measure protein
MSIIIPIVSAWDSKGLNKAIRDIQRAEGSFKKFTVATDAIGKSLKNTGKSLSMNVTAPLALAGGAAVNLAIGFDSSMTKIVSLVGIASTEVDGMRTQVLKLSGETAKAPQELADGLFVLTSAGLRGNDALSALEYAAKASSAGLGETSDIARAVAGAMTAYGTETINASKATDIITATARSGNFEVSQFSAALGKVLPFANQAGASLEDVGGAVALLTRVNGDAAVSVTQVQALLKAFVVPTAEAVKALDSVGLSAEDLRNAISTDGLPAAMEMLDKKLGGNREQLGRLLGSSEAASAAFSILDADAEALAGTFGVTADAAGMTQSAFDTTADTAGFKMQKSLNGLKVVAIELGDTLVPFVEKLTVVMEKATAKFQALSPEQKDMIVKIGLIVAAIGPMLIILGSVIGALGNVAKGAKALGIALQFLTMNPIGAVILGIVALIAIIVILVKNWDKIKEAASNAWARIKEIVGSAKDFIVSKMQAIGDFIVKYHPLAILFRLAQEWLPKIKERFGKIGSDLVAGIRQGINNAWASFKTFFVNKIGNPIQWAKEALGIASPSKVFAEIGKNVVKGFENGVKTLDAKKITDKFKKVTSKVNEALSKDLDGAKSKLKEAQDNLKNYASSVANSLSSGFTFSGALEASVKSQNDAAESAKKLAEAQKEYKKALKDPEDIEGIAKALSELTAAQKENAKATSNKKTFMQTLREQAKEANAYSKKIQQLIKMGLSESALNQVLAAGQEAGTKIADELIAGGSGAISETNKLTKSVESLATKVGNIAGKQFYQQGVDDGKAYVDGVKEAMAEAKIFQNKFAQKLVQDTLSGYKKSGGVLTKKEKQAVIDLAKGLGVDIPKMAKGGIVTSPTLAMIGEAGPEAVIPLSGRNAGMGTVYNINVNAGIGTNGAQVGRDIVDAIKKYERASGPVFASA